MVLSRLLDVLDNEGVDVVSLAGTTYSAQESGAPLFMVEMQVSLLGSVDVEDVYGALDELSKKTGWDIDFSPAYPGPIAAQVKADAHYLPFPPSRSSFSRVAQRIRRLPPTG